MIGQTDKMVKTKRPGKVATMRAPNKAELKTSIQASNVAIVKKWVILWLIVGA